MNIAKKIIALVEIIGGVVGIGISVMFIGQLGAFIVIFFAAFGLSLFAGVQLWRGKQIGTTLSIIVQLLQVPVLNLSAFVYSFVSGLSISLLFGDGVHANFYLGSSIQLQTEVQPPESWGVNLVALVFLILLIVSKKSAPQTPAQGVTSS